MADNIVGGLFGIDPSQIQQQRLAQDFKEGYMLAQLTPMEQATAGMYAGAKQLSRAGQGLLGMEDPQLQEAAMAKQLAANFDVNSVEGLKGLSAALAKAGSPRYSQLAAQQAMDLEKQGLGLRKERAAVEKSEMSAAQEEKLRTELSQLSPNASDADIIAIVSKYGTPDKILQVLTASKDRATARAVAASNKAAAPSKPLSAGLQKSEDSDLAKIDTLQAQSDALAPSIANLTKDATGKRALDLNPSKIAVYNAQNLAGNSSPESIKYSALKSAVDTAVNLQVSAEKGVQTDKDVLRFANALIAAYGRYDSDATLEALKNYNNAVVKAKTKTENIIQSRRKSQRVDPYEFASSSEAPSTTPQTKEVDFNTLPKRESK